MATNTAINVGVRRLVYQLTTPEHRNYEPKGGQLYKSNQTGLYYKGTQYNVGSQIPYDDVVNNVYTDDDLMERYFNAGQIYPST